MTGSQNPEVGKVYRSDSQADVFGGQYRVTRHVKDRDYEVEYLPPDDVTQDLILEFWVSQEARGALTSPVWDKTWAECDETKGERPQVVRWRTYDEMLQRDLDYYYDRAGETRVWTFVSHEEYANHF